MSTYPFDRQFQQRLELIFKKAEYDQMQERRRQKAAQETQAEAPKSDNGTTCQKPAAAAPAPKPR